MGLNQSFVFSTSVSDTDQDSEFVIEFFQCLNDETPEGIPYKVTKTFDELIDFFEQIEE